MIKFFRTKDEFGCFSNFYMSRIFIDSKLWITSEHYYQAKKFNDESMIEQIRSLPTPRRAADFGRAQNPMREDWDIIKFDVMKKVVMSKFSQHKKLQDILISTGNEELVEDSPYDSIWGRGPDWKGQNHLGRILMETRDFLKKTV